MSNTEDGMEGSLTVQIVMSLLLIAIPATLIGNIMVLVVITRLKRVTTHYILLNIAVCDFLSGFLAQPILLLNLTGWDSEFHKEYPWMCNILGIISALLVYVSIFTVAGIAVDRCLVVKLKHRYKFIVTRRRMLAVICTIWTTALLMVYPVPKLLFCRSYYFKYISNRMMCVAADDTTGTPGPVGCKKTVAFVEAIALIALPVLIVFVSSTVLIVGLYRKLCAQSTVVKRSVETVVVMVAGFYICVLPYCVTVPIDPVNLGGPGMLILIFLMHLHSTINPLIYLLRSSKFRRQAIVIGSEFLKSIDKRQQLKSIRRSMKRTPND